jgi:hypothetical protein
VSGKVHLMVATPCYGGAVSSLYHECMMRLMATAVPAGIDITPVVRPGDSLITRARNELLAQFLSFPAATHLLFIDADIGFPPEQVRRLLTFDAEFVAAAYPLKRVNWESARKHTSANFRPEQVHSYVYQLADPRRIEGRNDFVKVVYVGNGFMMLRRSALEKMCAAYPKLKYTHVHSPTLGAVDPERRYALFECMIDPETGTYLSEDYAFCKRWTDIGGEIWVDTKSKLQHVGPVTFDGDLSTQLTPITP